MESSATIVEHDPHALLWTLNDIETKHVPKHLYTLGDVGLLTAGRRVAVVGTRHPSAAGIRRTKALVKALVDQGIVVVSGLAEGIDTVAHETAIECGGKTIAVLGTSLDTIYPAKNRVLFQRIAGDHLAISQFPSGYPSQPKNFPMRNRTMALISDATVIVEAGEKSGTRHQGWETLRLGRELLLLESVVAESKTSWAREMIDYGATVLTRESVADVLEELPAYTTRAELVF